MLTALVLALLLAGCGERAPAAHADERSVSRDGERLGSYRLSAPARPLAWLRGPSFDEPDRVAWAIRRGRRLARLTVVY